MSIKFEGEPPFDLGVAQTVSAQVLDATVVLRVTVAVPEIRSKPVPVRFTMTAELAKAFLEQFGTVVTMAELNKLARAPSHSIFVRIAPLPRGQNTRMNDACATFGHAKFADANSRRLPIFQ